MTQNIPTFEKLGLPPTIEKLCHYEQGMVLLAGVTGSGKSTTIASMLDYMNAREALHILTIEDPIEFVFTDKMSIVNQREVYLDVSDWHTALKHAVREDPDVILVGEMRDADTFEAAVHAAETGHVVFGTIHASNAYSTIDRILGFFPPNQHGAVRQSLVFNLRAVVAQKLIPSIKPGVQRVPDERDHDRQPDDSRPHPEAQDEKLLDAIRAFYNEGMMDFNKNLEDLVLNGSHRQGDRARVLAESGAVADGAQGHQGRGIGAGVMLACLTSLNPRSTISLSFRTNTHLFAKAGWVHTTTRPRASLFVGR